MIRDIRLPALYNEKKPHLKQGLAAATSVAITTDHWTSAATNNYTTITSHYIDPEWIMRSNVLLTRSAGKSHTSDNLVAEMTSCFDEFDIEDKVEFISTDNASNVTKAARDLTEHHPCPAHTLNLAVKARKTWWPNSKPL